jgi:hypothetical protein
MKTPTIGLGVQDLQVGQAVEVERGALLGIGGALLGFSPEGNCRIKLDLVQSGVVLIINPAAVRPRPLIEATISNLPDSGWQN